MAADRAAAIAAAEAALSDAEVDELARRLCLLLRSAWMRRQCQHAAHMDRGRGLFQSSPRPRHSAREEEGDDGTRPAVIVQRPQRP